VCGGECDQRLALSVVEVLEPLDLLGRD